MLRKLLLLVLFLSASGINAMQNSNVRVSKAEWGHMLCNLRHENNSVVCGLMADILLLVNPAITKKDLINMFRPESDQEHPRRKLMVPFPVLQRIYANIVATRSKEILRSPSVVDKNIKTT